MKKLKAVLILVLILILAGGGFGLYLSSAIQYAFTLAPSSLFPA
jgi:hypothetical protein